MLLGLFPLKHLIFFLCSMELMFRLLYIRRISFSVPIYLEFAKLLVCLQPSHFLWGVRVFHFYDYIRDIFWVFWEASTLTIPIILKFQSFQSALHFLDVFSEKLFKFDFSLTGTLISPALSFVPASLFSMSCILFVMLESVAPVLFLRFYASRLVSIYIFFYCFNFPRRS